MNAEHGADVVVVGSGLCGLTVANELAAAGVRDVLVLESGPPNGTLAPQSARGHAALPAWTTNNPPHYGPPGSERPDSPPSASQARGVGGRSLHWHGVILRIEDYALDDPCWPETTRTRLTGDAGNAGLYEQVEDELARWRVATPESRTAAARQEEGDGAFAEMLAAATGLPARSVPQAVRYSSIPGAPRRAYTPLDHFHELSGRLGTEPRAARRTGTPRIAPNLAAVAVLSTRGAASGVLAHDSVLGRHVELHASTVVLAAGTMENTRLVAQLRQGDGPARYDGLNDHLAQGFVVLVPTNRLPVAVRSGAFALLARDRELRCNVFARLHAGAPLAGNSMLLDVWALGEQSRSSASHVSVTPPRYGAPWPWITTVSAGLSDDDQHVLAGERDLLASVWARLAAACGVKHAPLHFPDFFTAPRPFHAARNEAISSLPAAVLTYAWPLGASDHEGGTLPLGAVLDSAGAVREIDGVFVTGPATFPRPGAANPSLTTLALAKLTARTIRERRG